MGESSGIRDILLFLGVLMLLVGFIMPGSNPAWVALGNTLANPPQMPGNNPYNRQVGTLTMKIVGNGTWGLSTSDFTFGNNAVSPSGTFQDAPTTGCGDGAHVNSGVAYPGAYWDCLNSKDGQHSGVFMNGVSTTTGATRNEGFGFVVRLGNITGTDLRQRILNVTVSSECNVQTTTNGTFNVNFIQTKTVQGDWPSPVRYPVVESIGLASPVGATTCDYGSLPTPFGGKWFNVTNYLNYQNGFQVGEQTLANFSGAEMMVTVKQWDVRLDISYMTVTVNYLKENTVSNPPCGTFDIGCVFSNFVNWLSDVVTFGIGLLTYAISWVIWLATVGIQFVGGLLAALAWFLAIPGCPAIIQSIIDVVFIAVIGYLLFIIAKTVRGTGTVA